MRVAIISLFVALFAGLAAFLMLDTHQAPKKQEETQGKTQDQSPLSQPAPGLVPVSPASPPTAESVPSTVAPPVAGSVAEPDKSVKSVKSGLAPPPVDPSTPDEVVMASHPALVMRGQARWDDGYSVLARHFTQLRQSAQQLGLTETGYPVTVFVETDDQGFKFEAEWPVLSLPLQRPADLPAEIRFGATPEGKAIRFVHRGAYDEIDSTYEAISAYVDVKGFEVKDTLIEEYIDLGTDSSDMAIEVHIFVQPVSK